MSKFTNLDTVRNSIETMVSNAAKSKLTNPYYLFGQKSAILATYYNLNTTMTTLDEAARSNYGEISANSPLRYNKINGLYLYGVSQIQPNFNIGEFGLEADDISGDMFVLPYTIVPYPGDYFTIDSIDSDSKYLFKVTTVNPNTLDTGATMYKFNYTLTYSDRNQGDIEKQVVKTYKFVPSNIGTNFASIIEEETYDAASGLEEYTTKLKDYFMGLFYDPKIQSFAYSADGRIGPFGETNPMGARVYDPYLIEFIIRNGILDGASEYVYVEQQMYLPPTFGIDYDKTIFSSIEQGSITTHYGKMNGNIYYVDQQLSLLYAYPIDYYYMEYAHLNGALPIIHIFDDPGFNKLIENNDQSCDNVMKNIIIGYFNGETTVTDAQLNSLKHMDYRSTRELFYLIPIIIFIFEQIISSLLSTDAEDTTTE